MNDIELVDAMVAEYGNPYVTKEGMKRCLAVAVAGIEGRLVAENKRLREVLTATMGAIASLPDDALGYSFDDHHPIQAELLHNIKQALEDADK